MELQGRVLSDEIQSWVNTEVQGYLNQNYAGWGFPPLKKTGKKGDFTLIVGEVCGKRKLNQKEFTDKLANELIGYVNSNKNSLVQKVEATAPGYLNLWINRTFIYTRAIKAVLALGDGYGKLDVMKGKKVIVEHTSANPNGPLHIGNLRNVILGGILANILQNVGYDVKQHFYVNDLGAQIGLTALGFVKIYDRLEPKLKIDQWIGMIYAIMNTFVELQALGQNLIQLYEIANNPKCVELHQKIEAAKQYVASLNSQSKEKIEEFFLIFVDLRDRQPELFDALYAECKGNPTLKKSGGELNLRYESNDPEAVKIFRKMVIADLTGMQQTLDIFGIKHDKFDFESELGWEGSNDRVLNIMKASPYFSPPTQSNAKGVPEGGYFDLDQFIKDKKLPQGKKGYQPDYPPLYVLRPDGSTLYTFRDVVYSLKKVAKADMVLNVIATEQNVAQEKVALSLELVDPGKPRKQFHVSYDLVKLLNDEGNEVKMSGRRARYVLADDVYEELRSVLRQMMIAKFAEKGKPEDPELFETVINEVSTAAIKYALVSMSCRSKINFNIKKVCDFDDSSAPFLLYNATRFFSLFRKYEKGVQDGVYPALPPVDQIDWTLLKEEPEWELMWDFILGFPSLIQFIACPQIPDVPALPEWNVHLLCDFLISLVRSFSKYWASTRILKENPSKEEAAVMVARLYLLKSVQLVLNNGLKMLTITPLEKM